MNWRKLRSSIPWLPVSAICFYLAAIALWQVGALPSPQGIIEVLERFYARYGLTLLFISAFLEGLVYVGMYFSGGFLIFLGVLFSDGSFSSLLSISVVVALALTLVNLVNYWMGRWFSDETESESTWGLFLSLLHPNALAFYWFNMGLRGRPIRRILYIPVLIIPYGLGHAYLIKSLEEPFRRSSETLYLFLAALLIWLVISWWWNYSGNSSTTSSSTALGSRN